MAMILDGTNGLTTPGVVNTAGETIATNLTFTGTGNRITGDMSNATIANRVAFQTSTANETTGFAVLPNGTGTVSQLLLYNNSNSANSSLLNVMITAGEARFGSGIAGTGTYLPITFYTNGSERVRIDTSGNVGIGTSSPTVKLQVNGVISSNDTVQATSGTTVNVLSTAGGGEGVVGTISNHALQFRTNNTERMRIDSSGNLLVGTTTIGFTNSRSFNFQGLGDGKVYVNHSTANSSGDGYIGFGYNGGQIGSITQNGTTAVAYNTSSDYRLKENIAPMTGALSTVSQLKPVTYSWKADGSDGQGFIAHELQAVVPDCVTGKKDAVDAEGNPVHQGIDTSFLVATLTAAIQELKAIVDAQAVRIAALEV
jgi:hypothetical protein